MSIDGASHGFSQPLHRSPNREEEEEEETRGGKGAQQRNSSY